MEAFGSQTRGSVHVRFSVLPSGTASSREACLQGRNKTHPHNSNSSIKQKYGDAQA